MQFEEHIGITNQFRYATVFDQLIIIECLIRTFDSYPFVTGARVRNGGGYAVFYRTGFVAEYDGNGITGLSVENLVAEILGVQSGDRGLVITRGTNSFRVIFGFLAVLLIAVISSVYHIDFNKFINSVNDNLTNDSKTTEKIKVSLAGCIDGDTARFTEDGNTYTYNKGMITNIMWETALGSYVADYIKFFKASTADGEIKAFMQDVKISAELTKKYNKIFFI